MATVELREGRGVVPKLVLPTEGEVALARESSPKLNAALDKSGADVRVVVRGEDGAENELDLPPLALALLGRILEMMAVGDAVALDRVSPVLSFMGAASLLGVSIPFVEKLIQDGEFPCHIVGTFERVKLKDLMAYQERSYRAANLALDEMVAINQELGLYDCP